MKKFYYSLILALVATLFAVGCTQDLTTDENLLPTDNVVKELMEVTASLECDTNDDATRAILLDNNGGKIAWNEGDAIGAISSNGTITKCVASNISGSSATFAVPTDTKYAIFPYVSSSTFDANSNTMSYTMPNTRSVDGSNKVFGANDNVMCAHLSENSLAFKNLCGYVEVRLKGTGTVKHVALRNNSGNWDALSGLGTINFSDPNEPKVTTGTNHGTTFNFAYLTCSVALSTSEATSFYFIVPPRTYKHLSICVQTDKGSYSVISQNAITVNRSKIRPIEAINIDDLKPATSIDLSVGGVANCYIVPQGSQAKYYSFPARKINDASNLANVAYAHISWSESSSLVNNVCYDAATGMISFKYEGNNAEGNAHIALLGSDNKIIWFNHIWCTDQPEKLVINSGTTNYGILDRNLGATYTPKTVAEAQSISIKDASDAIGLYYQNGRPSPFPRINSMADGNEATAFKSNTRIAVQYAFAQYNQLMTFSNAVNAYDAAIKFPKAFYYIGFSSADGSSSTYNKTGSNATWYGKTVKSMLWYSESGDIVSKKATNDPCPAGYVLDDETSVLNWMKKTYTPVANTAGTGTLGYYYQCPTTNDVVYLPTQGFRSYNTAKATYITQNYNLWAAFETTPIHNLNCVRIHGASPTINSAFTQQSHGFGVRCRVADRSDLQEGLERPEKKHSLSILFVGNSLTQDGIAYLPYMLKHYYPEIDFKIYMWYIGGKTMGDHYSSFTSDGKAGIFSTAVNSESWTNHSNNVTMKSVLSNYTFDIVCLQEYFSYKTSYTDCTDWNNCRNFIVDNYKGDNELKFMSLLHAPLRKSGYDVHETYKKMMEGNALILKTTVSEDIIPFGIAVYNALSTDLNNLGDLGQLSNDGTHTQEGLPCLLQTYVALSWLFDKFGMDKTVRGNPLRMTTEIYNRISVPGANLGSGVVEGTEEQYQLAQEIAISAFNEGKQFLQENRQKAN